jgi:protein-S-isoprenylcysteine O-methyltransferase Ste14
LQVNSPGAPVRAFGGPNEYAPAPAAERIAEAPAASALAHERSRIRIRRTSAQTSVSSGGRPEGELSLDVTRMSVARRLCLDAGFVSMILGLPLLTWYFAIAFVYYDAALVWPGAEFWSHVEPPTAASVTFYVSWVGLQAALFAVLPGRTAEGQPLPDGRRLEYRLNGLLAFAITLALAAAAVGLGLLPAGWLFDQWGALVTTSNLAVLLGCAGLVVLGRRQATPEERRLNWLEAYALGACRNPRIGRFDLKFFCESRPSMILWVLVDLGLAAKQLELHGTVSNAMILVCFLQVLYVADYFVFEEAILTTWDIKHESFGFVLAWGCLVWIPFAYSLQPLYLVAHPEPLPAWGAAAVVALAALGFFVFRTSNLQKHRFSMDPMEPIWGQKPEFIRTAQGRLLLTSGWWGVSRHSNYLGDWLMGLSWSLTCGFSRALPYFYPVYFAILLVHREWRDAKHCASKYGPDWVRYTEKVRWRIIPGIY